MEEIDTSPNADLGEFNRRRPLYQSLVDEVKFVLVENLRAKNIKHAISGRAKDAESFQSKVTRKKYQKPLDEITDFAGVRVVCYHEADAVEVASLLRAEFTLCDYVDKTLGLGVDKMGYGGAHFIVSLGSRYSGPRYDQLKALKCEIQVRTVLQDAWATISHQLAYKNEDSVPPRLQRDLNNVASLLEIAQRIFDSVRDQRVAYVREIEGKENNPAAFLAQPLDYETLLAYSRWKFPNLPASDKLNSLLLQDLNQQNYPTLAHIDKAVERAKSAVEAYRLENPKWFISGTDFITKSLGFIDAQFLARHGFAKRTRDAIVKYRHLVSP